MDIIIPKPAPVYSVHVCMFPEMWIIKIWSIYLSEDTYSSSLLFFFGVFLFGVFLLGVFLLGYTRFISCDITELASTTAAILYSLYYLPLYYYTPYCFPTIKTRRKSFSRHILGYIILYFCLGKRDTGSGPP